MNLVLYKLIILYMLDRVDEYTLTNEKLTSFIQDRGYTSLFNVHESISELIADGFISVNTIRDVQHYQITDDGEKQTLILSKEKELQDAQLIICSPYTRTMQTASILSRELNLNIKVEIDLMEWIPDKTYLYNDYSKVVSWREHYDKNNGKNLYSDDNFEEKNEIIKRVKSVLEKYNNYKKVIVVTHGMVINALTGISKPECAHFYKYSLNK